MDLGSNLTTIDNNYFRNYLISITIPNTVKNIGEFAFAATNLSSVIIPNLVTVIGTNTFNHNHLT